jgi:hypothetical protein
MDTSQKRRMKAGLSRKMLALAEARKCPDCGRKMALTIIRGTFPSIHICRFCRYGQ